MLKYGYIFTIPVFIEFLTRGRGGLKSYGEQSSADTFEWYQELLYILFISCYDIYFNFDSFFFLKSMLKFFPSFLDTEVTRTHFGKVEYVA